MASSAPRREPPGPAPAAAAGAAEDLLRADAVVLAAAALPPDEWSAYLRQVTVADTTLLADVRRRLAHAAQLPDTFLAIPAAELLAAADPAGALPVPAAPPVPAAERYEILAPAGAGGMAEVHQAFDRQLRRPVAVKLLRRGEPAARRRFLAEARAQARVRHDNVLEIYETGELAGRPFLAMRWVDGPTLLGVRAETSLEQQVRLVAQVAEGLHAAHREGLIHRDVKPSNVLVERTPDGGLKAWIADFGIAEALSTDDTPDGTPAALAGSPPYMAPEVVAGEPADRRTDVYGLGATLYELLTGVPPFAAPDLFQLLRAVREEPPRPPRAHRPALPAELEAVVLKCLEKDPARRYPSARALAEDLARFLDGQVVEAHAATLAHRLTKFALRHRRLLAVAGIGGVLLAAALAVAAALGLEARAANRRAELRRGQAEDLLGFLLTDLRGRLEPLGRLDVLDAVGERALGYFAAVPEGELTDAELAHRSRALSQIGDVRLQRGDLAGALRSFRQSLALAEALVRRRPQDAEPRFALGQSHFWVGRAFWEKGDLAAARPHFRAYLDVSRRLAREKPADPALQLELSYAWSNLGSMERRQARLAPALAAFQSTLAVQRRLLAGRPADRDLGMEVAATHDLLAATWMEMGRLDAALPHLNAQSRQLAALAVRHPGDFELRQFLGTSHDSLELWHEARGQLAEALQHARAAGGIFARLAAHDPENQLWAWQRELARAKEAHLLGHSGEPAAGREQLAAVAQAAAGHAAADPGDGKWRLLGARARVQLAAALAAAGRTEEARRHAAAAVSDLDALARRQPEDADTLRWQARALILLGRLESRRGDPAAAAAAWRRARARLDPAARDPRQARQVEIQDTWASLLLAEGRAAEARPVLARLHAAGYRQPDFVALCREHGVDLPTTAAPQRRDA